MTQPAYSGPAELALPDGPLILAIELRIEHDEYLSSWEATITGANLPAEVYAAVGSIVEIRPTSGGVGQALVASIERLGAIEGDGVSVVTLVGNGPPPTPDSDEPLALDQ